MFGGRAKLAAANGLKALWLAYLSQPSSDRVLYRLIRKRKVCRIVEIGIGAGQRLLRMISLAQRYRPASEVRYTGIDWFEARPAESGECLSLKQAYRLLRRTSARIHLVPSDAHEAFARVANALSGNELVTISSDQPPESLGRIWFFLPRMLAAGAAVFFSRTTDEAPSWRPLSLAEIRQLRRAAPPGGVAVAEFVRIPMQLATSRNSHEFRYEFPRWAAGLATAAWQSCCPLFPDSPTRRFSLRRTDRRARRHRDNSMSRRAG